MTSNKNDEIVYLNNCQILIQSLSHKVKGTYYLVWKKGKKSTQSNKYQIVNDQPINPKDLLSLSLKVYYQGNVPLERHTHLILFNGAGEQINRCKLMIHEWGAEFREMGMNVGGATVKLKVKRKGVMKLQKFHRLRSEVEQTSEDEAARFLRKVSNKPSLTDKEEILRLTKEVQDQNFLLEKLKEQRNAGLSKIQKLQDELSKVNSRMRKDLQKARDYYTLKIQLRESIYKEQIQQLITSFNRNYELNIGMMEELIRQKFQYEEEIAELKESNHQYITKQSQNFEKLISEMQQHKQEVDEQLRDSNQKLHEREETISQLNNEIERLNEELQGQKTNFKKFRQAKAEQDEEMQNTLNELNAKIMEETTNNNQANLTIDRLNAELTIKEESIISLNKMLTEANTDKTQLHAQNMRLMDETETLKHQNQILRLKVQNGQKQVKDMHDEMQKIRLQYDELTNKFRKDMDERHELFKKQIEGEREQNFILTQRIEEVYNEKQIMASQLAEAQSLNEHSNQEMLIMKNQLQHDKQLTEQLSRQMNENLQNFKRHQTDLTDKLSQYILKNNQLEQQNFQINNQLKQVSIRTHDELTKMKEQYQILSESNRRLLEDQIQMIKRDKLDEEANFLTMKNDYESQIISMMESHKNEVQDIQKLYRQDSQRKDKQMYQMIQEKALLMQEFQTFKFKTQMDWAKSQQDNQWKEMRKKPNRMYPNIEQIEEASNESIQEVEEDEQSQELIKPKQKPKKGLSKKQPIKIQQSSEQQIELQQINSQQQQGEGQESNDSIFAKLKKKKLGNKKKPLKNILVESLQFSSEEQLSNSKQKSGQSEGKGSDQSQKKPKPSKKLKKKKQQKKEDHQDDQIIQQQEEIVQINIKSPSQIKKKKKQKVEQIQSEEQSVIQVQEPKKPKPKKQRKPEVDVDQLINDKQQLTQKIEELEQQIQSLNKNEKRLKQKSERQSKKYNMKSKTLEEQIKIQRIQIEDLIAKLSLQDKDMAERMKTQSANKRKLSQKRIQEQIKSNQKQQKKAKQLQIKQQKQQIQTPRSKKSNKKIESDQELRQQGKNDKKNQKQAIQKRFKLKIQNLQKLLNEKQHTIDQLQGSLKTVTRQANKLKYQLGQKNNLKQSKVLQRQKIITPSFMGGGQSLLKQSIINLEDKVSNQKEKYQELKMRFQYKVKQNQNIQTQYRKLKKHNQQLQQKIKRNSVPKSVQEVQNEVDECNRKILEISRTLNQARLQRDSFDDEIRLLKKKVAQTNKIYQQTESKLSQSYKQTDELKRKQQRNKRQLQEGQEEYKRIKDINKKLIEQIAEIRKSQNQFVMQRKKVLDEVVRLEGVIAQKETDLIRVNKQMQRQKLKIIDTTDTKQGKQRQIRTELQKLQIQRSKLQRKNRQNQEMIKNLKQKLQTAEKQAKKSMDERKQTYGDKLKRYIEQIKAVKQIVEEYQQQNSRLKIQNSQFFEQNQILKMSYQKLELKHEELNQYNLQQNDLLKKANDKIAQLQDNLKKKQAEQGKTQLLITSMRKQLENQRVLSRKKTEKLQMYQDQNQRYIYDIKNFKLKLNQYQINFQQKQKLNEQVYSSRKTIDSLQQQLQKIANEYHYHSQKYVYTKDDFQKVLREVKEHEDQLKQQQFAKLISQLDQNNKANRQKMENQLLSLYNQNQKLRVNMHKSNQDLLEMQIQLAQLQTYKQKCQRLEKQKTVLERRVAELSDEVNSMREQHRRMEIRYNESIRNQEGKNTENVVLLQKFDEVSKRYEQLNDSYNDLKIDTKTLIDKYKASNKEKDENIEKMSNQIQNFTSKLLASELQINRLKENQGFLNQDYMKKLKKLEGKLQESSEYFRQKQKQSDVQNKTIIRQLRTKNTKLQQDMMDKMRRIEQLNEGVLMLQTQVEQLTDELTSNRGQLAEEGEIYTFQINKLRNQMKQMEQLYDRNMKGLEQELSSLSKELTSLKFARENGNNSRLRGSRQSVEEGDEKMAKRFDQKMKMKDRRIDELKQTIRAFEDRMIQVKGKQNRSEQVDMLKVRFSQSEKEWRQNLQKKTYENKKISEQYTNMSNQYHKLKIKIEELMLRLEEKDLEISSLTSELNTIHKLYAQLQKEIDKRKENLNQHLKSESHNIIELQRTKKQLQIRQDKVNELSTKVKDYQLLIRKKQQQITVNKQKIDDLQRQRNTLLDQQRKKIDGESLAKLKIKQADAQLQHLRQQNRRLRNENNIIVKQNDSLKADLNQKNMSIKNLLQEISNNDKIINNSQIILSKFIALNQQCLAKFGTSLEELLPKSIQMKQSQNSMEQERQRLWEQNEELKFLYENKNLDYEQMRNKTYEINMLQLQKQQNMIKIEELDEKLSIIQRRNQDLQFKQKAIKMQLGNIYTNIDDLIQNNTRQLKTKIQNILIDNYI